MSSLRQDEQLRDYEAGTMSVFRRNGVLNEKKIPEKSKATGEIILSNRYGILEEEPDADSGGVNSNNPQPIMTTEENQIIDSDYGEKSRLVEGSMNVLGEERAKEVKKLWKRAKNPLVKSFLYKMLKKISYEECTLNQWLSKRGDSVVLNIKEFGFSRKRLKPDFICILGGIVGSVLILHREKQKAHGNITLDNICICDGRVKLINSFDIIGKKKSYKQDFVSLKNLLKGILGESQNHIDDLLHFFHVIDGLSEGPGSYDRNWALVYNHPVFWPINKRINFMLNIRLDYLSEHWSQFGGEFRDAVYFIPSDVADGWLSKVERSSPYKEILRNGDVSGPIQEKYLKRNVAMAFLTLSRDSIKHAGQYVTAMTQKRTERDLYILSPKFLPCLVQLSLHLKAVRDAAPSP